ncbi:acetamidase/formamidase family protein [Halorubrum sp. BV1]|uniref:acetamidase/formamidase family protein n=1 Tax=Halorubrum sp. BV1 TaxID=1498500 RepID=UPI001E52AA55|nr:acetamidase/formamidase family protein [Halorubrum sp. BV1]
MSWGYFDNSQEPVCRVESGDIVRIETVSHHAGDAPDYMMDEGVRKIYDEIDVENRGPGVHIVTGPIHVEGAEPGDVLECRILNLEPRLPYGSNVCANWGLLYDDFDDTEYVTIYEVDQETQTAHARFQYEYPDLYDTPGRIIDPKSVDREPVLADIRVPVRYHFGTAGVAPAADGKIDTVPPGIYGGNVDNRNFNVGTSMYYPVQVEGGLFTAGDSHIAEGDGEISGTAIEAHVDAVVQFFVRDDIDISAPLLETEEYWMTHAFDADLDIATRKAALEMISFLEETKGLSEPESYSLLSVAADFQSTQVVNGEKGMHCKLRKDLFPPSSD